MSMSTLRASYEAIAREHQLVIQDIGRKNFVRVFNNFGYGRCRIEGSVRRIGGFVKAIPSSKEVVNSTTEEEESAIARFIEQRQSQNFDNVSSKSFFDEEIFDENVTSVDGAIRRSIAEDEFLNAEFSQYEEDFVALAERWPEPARKNECTTVRKRSVCAGAHDDETNRLIERYFCHKKDVKKNVDYNMTNERDVSMPCSRSTRFVSQGFFNIPIQHKLDDASAALLNNVSSSIDNIGDSIRMVCSDTIPNVVNSVSNFNSTVAELAKGIPIFILAIAIVFKGGNVLKTIGGVSVITSLLQFVLPDYVWQYVADKWAAFTANYVSQFDLHGMMPLLLTFVHAFLLKSSSPAQLTSKMLAIGATMPKQAEGVETIAKAVLQLIEQVVNAIRTHYGYDEIVLLRANVEAIDRWIDKIKILAKEAHEGKLNVNVPNSDRIFALISEGNGLMSRYGERNGKHGLMLNTYMNQLNKLRIPFEAANIRDSTVRVPPLVIMLRGPPGVGKSLMTPYMIRQILAKVLPREQLDDLSANPDDFMYARQPEHVYWDGYRGQYCTIFDDFGQARDIAGSPDNEFMNLIRTGNGFKNQLHMADLNSKGNNAFRSRIIVCTSNLVRISPVSIIETEAVERRFDLDLIVSPKPEFSRVEDTNPWKRRMDWTKVTSAFDPDCYEFHRYDYMQRKVVEVLNYDEVMSRAVTMHNNIASRFDNYDDLLSIELEKTIDQRIFYESQMDVEIDDLLDVQEEAIENYDELDAICAPLNCKFAFLKNLYPKIFIDPATFKDRLNIVVKSSKTRVHMMIGYCEPTISSMLDGIVETTSTIKSIVSDKLSNLEKFFADKPIFKYIGIALGVCLTAFSVYSLFKLFTVPNGVGEASDEPRKGVRKYIPPYKRNVAEDSTAPKKSVWSKQVQFKRNVAETDKPVSYVASNEDESDTWIKTAESGYDENGDRICKKVMMRNTYELIKPEGKSCGLAQFVQGRLFIIPKHFITILEALDYSDDEIFTLRGISSERTCEIPFSCLKNFKQVTSMEGQDIVMCEAPTNINPHVDITKFFLDFKTMSRVKDLNLRLDIVRANVPASAYARGRLEGAIKVHPGYGEPYMVMKHWSYKAPTSFGDCGALVSFVDSSLGGARFVGMHVAGLQSGYGGAATVVCREDLSDCIKLFGQQIVSQIEDGGDYVSPPIIGSFTGLYKHKLTVPMASKNKVMPSVLNGAWGDSVYLPSQLKPIKDDDGEIIVPSKVALEAYIGHVKYFNQDIIDACAWDYYREFAKLTDGMDKSVFDFETAVAGQPGVEFCDGIPRGTSAGFPYSITVGNGKREFFGGEGDYKFDSVHALNMKQTVAELVDDAKHGIRHEHIYQDALKDEKRKINKVLTGKTRMISGSPLDYTIATRQYFLAFTMAMMQTRIDNGIAIGTNAYSTDWDKLARLLQSRGEKVFAGDFSRFDGSETSQIHNAILWIINKWYGDGNDMIREVLWSDVYNSKHINGNVVYEWNHSLPSGHPLTTPINSMYNHIAFRYCWVLAHGGDIASLADFNEHVYLVAYGDDNVINVSDEKAPIFNQSTLTTYMAELGLTYTNEHKDGTVTDTRNLSEVSFLKRAFRFEPLVDRFVAPIEMQTIRELPYWCKKGSAEEDTTVSNYEKALEEASLHGKEVFDAFFAETAPNVEKIIGYTPVFNNSKLYLFRCLNNVELY